MANSPLFTRFYNLIALILLLSAQLAHGQSPTTSSSGTSPSSTAVIYPGNSNWEYHGCFNETTEVPGTGGARAIAGGEPDRSTSMTAQSCLDICKSKGAVFAGVEYSRECFCAQYLNSLAKKLPDSECNLPCDGNSTQVCGGPLKLTVYTTRKAGSQGAGSKLAREAPVGSILALGIAMGTLLYLA